MEKKKHKNNAMNGNHKFDAVITGMREKNRGIN